MVSPLGKGIRHRSTWLVQAVIYTFGMVAASSVVGLTAGSVGLLLKQLNLMLPWALVSVISIVYGLREVGWLRLPIPQRPWQVPITWVARHRYWGSLAYGLCIGLGYLTFIPFPGFYIWQAAALVLGSPNLGLMLGALYGLGRALPVYSTVFLTRDPEFQPKYASFIFGQQPLWHRLSAVMLLAIGVLAATL